MQPVHPYIRISERLFTAVLITALLSACQQARKTLVLIVTPTATIHTSRSVFTATPLPTGTLSPTAPPTPMLAHTPEPVDLSSPILMALSPRACEHTTALPPSQVFNHRGGPQAIITGGEVQNGPLTFGAYLYCEEKQSDPQLDADIRGLSFMFEWSGKNRLSAEQFKCYSGFEPDIFPTGFGGYSDYCSQTGGIGFGLYLPRGRALDLSTAEIPFRYIFRALLPDGQQSGIVFSFILRRVNDGFMVVNAGFESLTKSDRSLTLPTLPPPPLAPPEETPIPQADLDQFVDNLLADINARRFDRLKAEMHSEFDFQILPLDQQARGREAAVQALEAGQLLVRKPHVQWRVPSFRFSRYFPGKAPSSVNSLETTGWGLSEQDQGYISIGLEDGRLVWSGLLLYADSFVNQIWLDGAPNPAGLIYQKDNQYFQVSADGTSRRLFQADAPVLFTPDGHLAVSGVAGQNQLTQYDVGTQDQQKRSLPGYLMWNVDEAAWANPRTLLVGLAETQEIDLSQGGSGRLALLNLESGQVEMLPIHAGTYAQPSTTADGGILYTAENGTVMVWRAGQSQAFPIPTVSIEGKPIRTVTSPVLSPDGKQLAGITTVQHEAKTLTAYVIISLTERTEHILQTFTTIPTDARIPQKLIFSPDSRWLAIQSQDFDLIQNGVWLFSVDGAQRIFLGTASSHPVWLDAENVIYTDVQYGIVRLQQYHLTTQTRTWLNLPAGRWNNDWGRGFPSISALLAPAQENQEK